VTGLVGVAISFLVVLHTFIVISTTVVIMAMQREVMLFYMFLFFSLFSLTALFPTFVVQYSRGFPT